MLADAAEQRKKLQGGDSEHRVGTAQTTGGEEPNVKPSRSPRPTTSSASGADGSGQGIHDGTGQRVLNDESSEVSFIDTNTIQREILVRFFSLVSLQEITKFKTTKRCIVHM